MNITKEKWFFLRETRAKALKEDPDKVFGLHKTGLEDYLSVIFPEVNDWINNNAVGVIDGKKYAYRPDYRSESLKLIIEFDGTLHYKNPTNIVNDKARNALYAKGGYKVIRIPFFIQLTNDVVISLLGRNVSEPLFNPEITSMSVQWKNTPAFMCPAGVERMARELIQFPQQMEVNMKRLAEESHNVPNGEILSGYKLLDEAINNVKSQENTSE